MCQQIVQFCSGSTRPLLFAGGLLSLLSAVALGYIACTSNAIYSDIAPQSATPLAYHLQLAAAGYLVLVALLSSYSAYYDQKHSIRALSFVASVNLLLALVAIGMLLPARHEVNSTVLETLKQAEKKYQFKDKGPDTPTSPAAPAAGANSQLERQNGEPLALDTKGRDRSARWISEATMSREEATTIWDRLQARGCCGLNKGADEWKPKIPKSCCVSPISEGDERHCKEIDADHQQGCANLIASYNLNLLIVLALIALVNLYLASISGISAYKTYNYAEASQNAYT